MCIVHVQVPAGVILWKPEQVPTFCFFLISGEVDFATPPTYKNRSRKIRPGNIVGDFPCLAGDAPCNTEMIAITELEILKVKKEDWLIFLGKNPGLLLLFKDEFVIE
jgi:CRP-like cAMP-binding protein